MLHLHGSGFDVVIDETHGAPQLVHWGAPLGDVDPASVVAALSRLGRRHGRMDQDAPLTVLPEHAGGWYARPGMGGARDDGQGWAPRFAPAGVAAIDGGVRIDAVDPVAGLELSTTVTLGHTMDVHCSVRNTGQGPYRLGHFEPVLALPAHAVEASTFVGRWSREAHWRRVTVDAGQALVAETWTGRTSHEHLPLVFAGEAGWGEWSGEVWGAHLAWSGNHVSRVVCLPSGERYLQLGELVHPGEIVLGEGETYSAPRIVAVYSAAGLTPATWGFHRRLRERPNHPRTPRKTLLNTWEAVYFDHDDATLRALADRAAQVGVERYVLDDGWFSSRRDDTSGLGDWVVSPEVYPNGLTPLVDYVTGKGLEFGIWVEPEMVNPDSDVCRAHPEWVATPDGYDPVLGRGQLLIDLTNPDCYAHVFGQLDALLGNHRIGFVKWDMNRIHAHTSDVAGRASVHRYTLAVYRLLDELQARHPGVEFESCASGGGRIDHEILDHTVRVWTSDCIDPLERQTIQRGTSMLIPPEVMGAHVASPHSHTTGRSHTLAFRTATALFGHFGIEWNLLTLDEAGLADVAEAVALHKRFRPLLHSADVVRFDPYLDGGHPVAWGHGVYAADRREALVAYVQLRTGPDLMAAPLRLPGLDQDATYRLERVALPGEGTMAALPVTALTGRQLAVHGIQLPVVNPESALLVHLVRQ